MEKKLRMSLMFVALVSLLLALSVNIAFACGPGYIVFVYECVPPVPAVPTDGDGNFIVIPGHSYFVILSDVCGDTTTIWLKGIHSDGTPWVAEFADRTVSSQQCTTPCFTIPSDIVCTIDVFVGTIDNEATRKLVTYTAYDGVPIPCETPTVPEFGTPIFVVASIAVVAIMVYRNRFQLLQKL